MEERIPILLLKTKSVPDDGYQDYFSSSSLLPTFVPVLEHRINKTNLGKIRTLLVERELTGHYGGMIFTSQRAVEAFASIVEEVESLSTAIALDSRPSNVFPLYTVGPATSRTLKTLLSSSSILQSYPCEIFGADTGNGENLAKYILSHYSSLHPLSSTTGEKPGLLFLVGEQRRDVIPKTLTSSTLPEGERIGVDELVVYETGVMETFPQDFEKQIAVGRRANPDVISIVVFSPSGCEAMLLSLGYIDPNGKLTKEGQKSVRWPSERTLDEERENVLGSATPRSEKPRYCIASIGPTTRDYLFNTWGFEVDVCAEKPSPAGVGEGISRFLNQRGINVKSDQSLAGKS